MHVFPDMHHFAGVLKSAYMHDRMDCRLEYFYCLLCPTSTATAISCSWFMHQYLWCVIQYMRSNRLVDSGVVCPP